MVNWKTTLFTVILWQGITHILELFRIHLKEYTTEKTTLLIEIIALLLAVLLVYHFC